VWLGFFLSCSEGNPIEMLDRSTWVDMNMEEWDFFHLTLVLIVITLSSCSTRTDGRTAGR
jgi:hypothetical protein